MIGTVYSTPPCVDVDGAGGQGGDLDLQGRDVATVTSQPRACPGDQVSVQDTGDVIKSSREPSTELDDVMR